jgi:mannose-6-phosphate isomerase-like protein (cupin superfamily)
METTQTPTACQLGRDNVIHLADELGITPLPIDPSFWSHSGNPTREMSEGRVLCVSDYAETWSWWERHPVGDELVYLISGDVDFLLRDEHEHRSITLLPGHAAIVPTGAWHRAIVRAPSRMLFVTPTPSRTELRQVAADEDAA